MKTTVKLFFVSLMAVALAAVLAQLPRELRAGETEKVWHDPAPNHKPYLNPSINENMTNLVRNSLPAIVSIATEQVIRQRGRGRGHGQVPFDDFFDFFFNQPFGQKFRQQGMGSGFIINAEGYILTNNHVVENADEITVQLDNGDEYPAKVIGRDETTDIALIKIDAGKTLPYLVLGDSDELDIGHTVVAMGNPFGLSQTVTRGIVSQKGRKDINPSGRRILANFIQTDASINPGNSGGALLNIYGEAVGINTAIAQGQGIGFAIPINMAKTLLPQLMEGKIQRSWIGIQVQKVTSELADSLGLEHARGALVAAVVDDSPAKAADIKPEDVILTFNGKTIEDYSDLIWLASVSGAGTKVRMDIYRDGKIIKKTVTLGARPGEAVADGTVSGDNADTSKKAHGMQVVTPDPRQLKAAGISDGKGAMVVNVDTDSSAYRAGLRKGDIIRKINAVMIRDAAHFAKTAKKFSDGQTIRLFVNRNRNALFIAFRI